MTADEEHQDSYMDRIDPNSSYINPKPAYFSEKNEPTDLDNSYMS